MNVPTIDELNLLHANICQALGDPKRILIMFELNKNPRNVSELAHDLDIPQPTVSRHLRVLRQRSLVISERDGASVYYHLADPRMIDILNQMRLVLRGALARQASVLSDNT
ncbi:MAG: ArsR/SmtB family transcription factor [Candidatus Promineifilaceae bacterium]|jgi:DNA-binding transcriptional ArsR family regulator